MDEPARARLTQLIDQRRIDLHMKLTDLATASGISASHLRRIMRGDVPIGDLSKSGLEAGLAWKSGSIDAIMDGGDPTADDEQPVLSATDLRTETERRIYSALIAGGETETIANLMIAHLRDLQYAQKVLRAENDAQNRDQHRNAAR